MTEGYPGARIYCARGATTWGLGFSKYQALDAADPTHDEEISVVKLPETAYQPTVDSVMGTLYWKGGEGDVEKIGYFRAAIDHDDEGVTEYTEIDSLTKK